MEATKLETSRSFGLSGMESIGTASAVFGMVSTHVALNPYITGLRLKTILARIFIFEIKKKDSLKVYF